MIRVYLLLLVLSLGTSHAWALESLPIDPSHSAVVFSWDHRGFSHPVARLERIEGRVLLDKSDMTRSSVSVKLRLAGLRTGDEHLDRRLNGFEFFDSNQYPAITFQSTRIELVGQSTLRILGDLTVRGVTKPVVLMARVNKIDDDRPKPRAGFDADATLRRSDFGVSKYVPMVTDEISVHITLEAGED
jgi:polyisoprenoid-binding protein YceI